MRSIECSSSLNQDSRLLIAHNTGMINTAASKEI